MKKVSILFVCHGNICRSPMAESVMAHMASQENLPINVNSAATSREAVGSAPHSMTRRILKEENIPLVPHTSVRLSKDDYDKYDLLIGMDSANIRNMKNYFGGDPENKISRLLDFTIQERDIEDPWYTDKYDITYRDVTYGCKELIKYLKENY